MVLQKQTQVHVILQGMVYLCSKTVYNVRNGMFQEHPLPSRDLLYHVDSADDCDRETGR